MKLIRNAGNERVIDDLKAVLKSGHQLDVATQKLSLFGLSELLPLLAQLSSARVLLSNSTVDLELLGNAHDRAARNKLQSHWLASQFNVWLQKIAKVRYAATEIPQGAIIVRDWESEPLEAFIGSLGLTTDGLGITPGNPLSFVQKSEINTDREMVSQWFDQQWDSLDASKSDMSAGNPLAQSLSEIASRRSPYSIYALMLHHLFSTKDEDYLDESRIVKDATGIRETLVWKKLYHFQRDGVIGALDKIARFGGCIIADSVGLGKTFEALAIIKYYELRNDRVLVLCPKRLRDNWTLYKANDRRNVLAGDRFHYDVLNHTDLIRDGGSSGDIDLAHVNWGNYDLVVIDESHNFRNKSTHKGRTSRYDRLMRQIIQQGVKTRVLMLSATPVNNRLADLRNQIAFVTEGNDTALAACGTSSIDRTTQLAQKQFNRWLDLESDEKTPARLVEMLGFDYFNLLDNLTIARSRKHIEKYYGTAETGKFPVRLKPINIKSPVDIDDEFPSIKEINQQIRRLTLAAYAPMRYVLPNKRDAYEAKYATEVRGKTSMFRQIDREESLIHLMRINMLKRMESAVSSFRMTVERQLEIVSELLERLDSPTQELETLEIEDVDIDDPLFESLLIGRGVKVLLSDVDRVRWRQDLTEDRNRLETLVSAAGQVGNARDAKLSALRELISIKCATPLNPGNKKIIVFTAFSDTARYLYEQLAPWASESLGLTCALVPGTGGNQTTVPKLRRDLGSILTAFSPRSKERPDEFSDDGEIDLLIATDCISEGQNLQDCDYLVNYDIHWNPVRIIQRFGRIDRIGSPNTCVQLVNFWPNMELEEYINLEQRVSGRMVLLDVSATGEENLIEQQSGNPMNDLDYRREQLLKLQDAVIDMEDLSTGVAITDLTLTDFRLDLSRYEQSNPGELASTLFGKFAVVPSEDGIEKGIVFCLQAASDLMLSKAEPGYPLAPYYLVHVTTDGLSTLIPHTQAKHILDNLKRLCTGRDIPDAAASSRFDRATKSGEDMRLPQKLLATAAASISGRRLERAVESLFTPGGTHATAGVGSGGVDDFEVVAFLAIC